MEPLVYLLAGAGWFGGLLYLVRVVLQLVRELRTPEVEVVRRPPQGWGR
jgi:uncharacterized membrane protein